jgi:hypothetical protein
MITMLMKVARAALFVAAAMLLLGDGLSFDRSGFFVSQAEARVGRPLTPVSYAGVARRTTRRAVAVGATVGAATVYSPGCVQRVDAYGRVYYTCP